MIITNYGIYNLHNSNIISDVIFKYQAYNVRPLAFFSDAFVFQWFWNGMYILLVSILIMHVCNVFFINKIAEKIGIKLNVFCLTLFALCPILVESVYWISASTRIVFSLFLCLASIYILLMYFDENKKKKKILYLTFSIILNLICVGYYEQTVALNLFLFVFVLLCLKKYKYIFIPILSTSWIGLWYLYFMINGKMQARGTLQFEGFLSRGISLVKYICTMYHNSYYNFKYSLGFGIESVINSPVSILLLGIILYFVYYIFKNKYLLSDGSFEWKKLALAGIFIVSPILPFLLLQSNMIAVRNLYFSTLGLAIILEIIADFIFEFLKNDFICNIIRTTLMFCTTVLFVISNLDGANNYKKVHELDNKVANQIIQNVDKKVFDEKQSISINYDVDRIADYKNLSNYVESVIESDWAMSGKLQVMRNDSSIGKIYINSMQNEADIVLYFDENMNLVTIVERNDGVYE